MGPPLAGMPPLKIETSRPLAYLEEFYRLYYLPQLFDNDNLNQNLHWLQTALKAPFAPPIQALVICKTPAEYERYQQLLRMHIHYLMTQNCVLLAARYDKHEPVFFNKEYSKEILESLEYARYHYECARNYWAVVLDFKRDLSKARFARVPDMEFSEDLLVRIDSGELDYRRVIDRQLAKLEKTKAYFQAP